MRSPGLRLITALSVGPPAGLLAAMNFSMLDVLRVQPSPSGIVVDYLSLLAASYLIGIIPAFVGGIIGGWICVYVASRVLRLLYSALAGAIVGSGLVALLTAPPEEPETLLLGVPPIVWYFGMVGAMAAFVSTALAEFIESRRNTRKAVR